MLPCMVNKLSSSQSNGLSRDSRKGLEFGFTVAGAVAGGATVLLDVLTKRPADVLPWALIVLGTLAIVPLLPVPRPVRLASAAAVAVALVATAFVVWLSPDRLSLRYPSAAPVQLTVSINGCKATVTFRGHPPSDWTYAIANQEAEHQTTYYLTDSVQYNQITGEGVGSMNVGTKKTTNTSFRMHVIAMPSNLRKALAETTVPKSSFWFQENLLPGQQQIVGSALVQRDESLANC